VLSLFIYYQRFQRTGQRLTIRTIKMRRRRRVSIFILRLQFRLSPESQSSYTKETDDEDASTIAKQTTKDLSVELSDELGLS